MTIEIRSYRATDEPQLHLMDEKTQREYRGLAWDSLDLDKRRELLWYGEQLPSDVDADFLLVAVDDDRLAGFLFACSDQLRPDRLRIDGVAVGRAYRRAGIGRALYAELIARAKRAGIRRLTTRISTDNEPSQRLHQAAGFALIDCVEANLIVRPATVAQ